MTCDGEYFEGCCVCFRLLELHSPDGQHTVVLRCKDGASAHSWFTAIHTNVAALLQQTMDQINSFLSNPSANTHCTLKHIGWLAEQVSHSHTHTHTFWFLWFTGTLHRRNSFYTVQTVCAIALNLTITGDCAFLLSPQKTHCVKTSAFCDLH